MTEPSLVSQGLELMVFGMGVVFRLFDDAGVRDHLHVQTGKQTRTRTRGGGCSGTCCFSIGCGSATVESIISGG